MKLALLLVVAVACSRHGDARRSRDELVKQVGDFAEQLHRGGPPQPGDLEDVRPPSDDELRWITDPSDHDPLERQILGIHLVQQCGQIGNAYLDQHRPDAVAWLIARIDVFAKMAEVAAGELTSDPDPKVARAGSDDVGEIAGMSIEIAEQDLRNLRGLPAGAFHEVIAGWRARVDKLRRLWTQGECDKVAGMIAIRVLGENDPAVKKALQDLARDLHGCTGAGR